MGAKPCRIDYTLIYLVDTYDFHVDIIEMIRITHCDCSCAIAPATSCGSAVKTNTDINSTFEMKHIHLKLCLATASHKWVKLTHICLVRDQACAHLDVNISDLIGR